MRKSTATDPRDRTIAAILGADWWAEDPLRQSSSGFLRWADRWARRTVTGFFTIIALVILLQQRDERARSLASFWALAALVLVVISWVLPRYRIFVPLLSKLPKRSLQWTACLFPMAGLASFALVYEFKLPLIVQIAMWPVFLPGAELIVRYSTQKDLYGKPVSRLTRQVLSYAGAAALFMTLPVCAFIAGTALEPLRLTPGGIIGRLTDIAVYFTPGLWTGISICFMYYLMRRTQLDHARAVMHYQLAIRFTEMDSPLESPSEVARMICDMFEYERVLVLTPNERYYQYFDSPKAERPSLRGIMTDPESRFEVVGAAGNNADLYLQPDKGFTFPMTDGITSKSMLLRKSIVADLRDIRGRGAVEPAGSDTRSELNVPIFSREDPDLILLHIIAQSSKPNAFTSRDMRSVEKIGKDLIANRRANHGLLPYQQIQSEIDQISRVHDYSDKILCALQAAQNMFDTKLVAFIPLGLGTGYPLWEKICTLEESFRDPGFFSSMKAKDEEGEILKAIREWSATFILDARSSAFWGAWAVQEQVRTLVLFPIGLAGQRIGLFFIGFGKLNYNVFTLRRLLITSFLQGLAPLLASSYYQKQYIQSLLGPVNALHRYLREEGLSRAEIRTKLEEVRDLNRDGNPELERFLERVVRLQDRMLEASNIQHPDFKDSNMKLQDVLVTYRNKRRQQSRYGSIEVMPRIDELVEQESPELRTTLYQFITEAISNALSHGGACHIAVRVRRKPNIIEVEVADDGQGFDPSTIAAYGEAEKDNSSSIRKLADLIQESCGADSINWGWTGVGRGTYVRIAIPVLLDDRASLVQADPDWLDILSKDPIRLRWHNPEPVLV